MGSVKAPTIVSAVSGILFGTGLAVSGMIDPARVRAFLDVGGAWDPTLAFVMGGALFPMALAWMFVGRRSRPLVESHFHLPPTRPIDLRLIGGAALFGIGWGLVGLCPGPAVAALAVHPGPALVFCSGMIAGFALFRRAADGAGRS
ncbi:DUF6691 family protein [Sphingomonas jeddahensis]|uniref:YeeE/YedE family protein n=1 Tax=Sphingomonas jeddahensis TaxID=1915074 RepID=A0A1V2EXA4_9SPHN|nr:DUF6691 family protein [Sphingomonas jeddahensis]ONF97127.1 hypothetical protein SPHI_05640 [Sphingomonas jeddahensis]